MPTLNIGCKVVDRASACLDDKDITNIDVEKDHSGLNKFVDDKDPVYMELCRIIGKLLEVIPVEGLVKG